MKFKKVAKGLKVSLAAQVAQASFRVSLPVQTADDAAKKVLTQASLYYDFKQQRAAVADNVEVPHAPTVLSDERYVYPNFRALSQTHLENRGLDFSVPGVLEAAVPMLVGKTVYLNHDFTDVNNWVGVVAKSAWDAAGDKSSGVAGINVQCKVDAFLNYRIACGVMMTPPAINAMSLTIAFEFEYSHPELEKEGRFWGLLGEEVEGQIVRLIVTKVIEIWEASFVFLGEDRFATNHGEDEDDDDDFDDESLAAAGLKRPPNSNEEKKSMLTLTKEKKAELGIEFDGDEVPDELVHEAIDALSAKAALADGLPENVEELKTQAAAGATLVEAKRTEVTAKAKLAELGAEAGDLEEVDQQMLAAADADTLIKLEKKYDKRIAERFPNGRSSQENSLEVDNAGGGDEKTKEPVRKAGLL